MDKDFDLDALLAEAAEMRVTPSPELTSRILQDAVNLQPKPQVWPQPIVRKEEPQSFSGGFFGWFTAFADVLGGGRAVAGLSLAALTGLYLGVAQPNLMQSLTSSTAADSTVSDQIDLLPATGTLWTEN